MKTLVCITALGLASVAHAEDKKATTPATTAAPAMDMTKMGPMTRPVTKPDNKGVDALYATMEAAMMKGDVETAATMIDYPVAMSTDDSKGEYVSDPMTKEQWVATMKPYMSAPMPKDMKMNSKHKVHFLSDTLAIAIEDHSMTMGKTKGTWTSASTLIKKGDKWFFKAMTEAGWGDMAKQAKAAAMAAGTTPAAPKTTTATK